MNRPSLEGMSDSQVEYLEYLEKCLNGSSDLIKQLNVAADTMANDLRIIIDDETEEDSRVIFLNGDSKDKKFERVMVLFDKIDKVKALAVITQEQPKDKPKKNIQDFALNGQA